MGEELPWKIEFFAESASPPFVFPVRISLEKLPETVRGKVLARIDLLKGTAQRSIRSDNRIQLSDGEGKAAIRLNWEGKDKKWLLTAFRSKEEGESATGSGSTDVADRTEPAPNPAGQEADKGSLHQTLNPYPYTSQIEGKLRETRLRMGKTRYRVLYFFDDERTAMLLHGFTKDTSSVEEADKKIGRTRMAEHNIRLEAKKLADKKPRKNNDCMG